MISIDARIDYLSGYIRYAHFECVIDDPEEEIYFKSLNEEDRKEYIRENGHIVIDYYSINDIGDITEILITDTEIL